MDVSSMYTFRIWLRINPTNSMMMDSITMDHVATDTLDCMEITIRLRESA